MNNQEKPITVGNITVSVAMQKAGSDIASHLINAQVSKCMGGLGGAKDWDSYEKEFKGENFDLIKLYVSSDSDENSMDSTTAMYIAMERARQREC